MSLDDLDALARIDPHGARGALAAFPAQCRTAQTLTASPPFTGRRPRIVVVAGMGGSASGGDLLAACAADLDIPPPGRQPHDGRRRLARRVHGHPRVAQGDAAVGWPPGA